MSSHKRSLLVYTLLTLVLFMCSTYTWRSSYIRYDIGGFDAVLASESPVFAIILTMVAGVTLMLATLKKLPGHVVTCLYISYFYIAYMGPNVANAPFYIHRDVFLHTPYSLYITEYGNIPSFPDRLDVASYPGSFILYSAYSCLTGIHDPRLLGLAMAIPYSLMLAVSILVLTRAFLFRGGNRDLHLECIIIAVVVLPFISRFAPAPGFPHRYHLAFIQALVLLYVFIQLMERRLRILEKIACMILLHLSLVFTHPYFSFLLAITMVAHPMLGLLLKRYQEYERLTPLYVVIPMLFVVHSLYLAFTGILQETYRILLGLPDRLMDFIEVSLPVRVRGVEQFITIASMVVRNAWRAYIAVTTLGTAFMYIYMLRKGKGIKLYAASLAIASTLLIPILIGSFLWWERSLTFISLVLLCALCEIISIGDKSENTPRLFKKYILPALFVLSVIISPLIRWERPMLSDNWQGYEKEVFMNTIASYVEDSGIYMGVYSAVDYTYYRVYLYPHSAPVAKTVFDPARGILTKDVSSLAGVYAVSARDPDYELLNLEQLLQSKNLAWSSGVSYVLFS